jgi:hypothetical protein
MTTQIKQLDYGYEDIISILENPLIRSMSLLEYGKTIQTIVEHYLTCKINSIAGEKLLIDVSEDSELMKIFNYINNGPGFDRLLFGSNKKFQMKFRQVQGKTPYSRQVHFENTRRHSEKNNNDSAKSGHVRYSVSEFDICLVVLCQIVNDGIRPPYTDWKYSLVNSSDLEDVNTPGYCLPNIPSRLLLKGKCDNIYELTNKIKNII